MEQTKFDILDEMRHIQVGNELPVTISIGIGNNITSLNNSKEDARIAFDLAQGRGGDQAIIKHHDKYTFYGGIHMVAECGWMVTAIICLPLYI